MMNSNWSKYYTPKLVANEIVAMIPKDFNPTKVVDICVGSGNFLDAATRKWNTIKAVGVDICLKNIVQKDKYILHEMDALNLDQLIKKIKKNPNELKIILANPPFGKLEDFREYSNPNAKLKLIYTEAVRVKRIEALMLVSNLNLLNKGDYFGAILPENFFTSTKLSKFREMFLNEFTEVIIGKKEEYFNNSEVKTRIFIGKHIGLTKDKLQNIQPKLIDKHNYLLYRGIDNSNLMLVESDETIEVLHFNNLEGTQKSKRFHPRNAAYERLIVSEKDTLILRVGRNSGWTYKAKKEFVDKYISDYFYLIKGISFNKKEHEMLQNILQAKRKGIASNYINKVDIINSINIILDMRLNS